MLRNILRPVVQTTRRGTRRYHAPSYKEPTMDDMIVPSGSWKEYNSRKQRGNNLLLAASTAIFVGTILLANVTGLIYLNSAPPKLQK